MTGLVAITFVNRAGARCAAYMPLFLLGMGRENALIDYLKSLGATLPEGQDTPQWAMAKLRTDLLNAPVGATT